MNLSKAEQLAQDGNDRNCRVFRKYSLGRLLPIRLSSRVRGEIYASYRSSMQASMSGFTLIELLVSVTLLGLITLAIQAGFRLGIRAWAKGEEKTEQNRNFQLAFDLVSRQLGSLVPYYSMQLFENARVEVLLFQGTQKGIRFVTPFSLRARGAAGFRLVEYFETDGLGKSGKALVAQESELPTDAVLGERVFNGFFRGDGGETVGIFLPFSVRGEAMLLVEGLEAADFGYFPQTVSKDREPVPIVQSQKKKRLPAGVELRLRWAESQAVSHKTFSVVVPFHVVS
jgi:prepilin-type N-terminal cleavage/methylation domain-containing protein